MPRCAFVSDLHGRSGRYQSLFSHIERTIPEIVLLGGDLFPHGFQMVSSKGDFLRGTLHLGFTELREKFGDHYPQVLLILGNDDARVLEQPVQDLGERDGLWTYLHDRSLQHSDLTFIGYNYVPPSPFQLKDWERYDVSRFVDPGAISPEAGRRTVEVDMRAERHATIQNDLEQLSDGIEMERAVLLAHSPPYETSLDRAALDGKMIDHVPLDVHVGSIAIRRWIEKNQPLLTLHGHVHESTRLTGSWREQLGQTWMFNAAHAGEELSVIEFDTDDLENAERLLI